MSVVILDYDFYHIDVILRITPHLGASRTDQNNTRSQRVRLKWYEKQGHGGWSNWRAAEVCCCWI